jgi:hypothetical protein
MELINFIDLTKPLVSKASQSPVPVGSSPIDRHFQSPTPNVNRLQAKYRSFAIGSVVMDFDFACTGANGANAGDTNEVFKILNLTVKG